MFFWTRCGSSREKPSGADLPSIGTLLSLLHHPRAAPFPQPHFFVQWVSLLPRMFALAANTAAVGGAAVEPRWRLEAEEAFGREPSHPFAAAAKHKSQSREDEHPPPRHAEDPANQDGYQRNHTKSKTLTKGEKGEKRVEG